MIGRPRIPPLADRRGFAYVMVLALLAIVAVTGTGFALFARMEAESAAAHTEALQALYVAEAGLEYGARALKVYKGNSAWTGVTDQAFGPGTFTVTVNYSPARPNGTVYPTVQLTSTSTVRGRYKRTVRRRFKLYPSMFGLAVYSQLSIDERDTDTVVTGGVASGTYASFPSIDWTAVAASATTTLLGNQTWSTPGGTKTGDFHITGNLTISAPTTVTGSLLVQGQITLTATALGTAITVPPSSAAWPAAIIASSSLKIDAANVTINGRVYGNDTVDIKNGRFTLKGGLYAKKKITNDPDSGGAGGYTTITYSPLVTGRAESFFTYGTGTTPARTLKLDPGSWFLVQ